jgi:predicted Zn-dependent protease
MLAMSKFALIILLLMSSWCEASFDPYSNDTLDKLSKSFAKIIYQSPQVVHETIANEYINELGHKLARQARVKHINFFIVKSPEINAFAGPGGYIGINTALILNTETESELASVMAHEIAHVRMHHLYRFMQHEKNMQIPLVAATLASAALGLANPALGSSAMLATMSGFTQDGINFTRANEKEADRIGINILKNSGFDPKGMLSFFKKMHIQSRYSYTLSNIPAILKTHPVDEARMAEILDRLPINAMHKPTKEFNYALFKAYIKAKSTNNQMDLIRYFTKLCPHESIQEACSYGEALTYQHDNQYEKSTIILNTLAKAHPHNRFIAIAYTSLPKQSENILTPILAKHPNDPALILRLADDLLSHQKLSEANLLLQKSFRIHPKHAQICDLLARTDAMLNKPAYAYFIKSQCDLIQGDKKTALISLKQAKRLSLKDEYLKARIDAKIEEIKS